jgi:hypothetical protein
MRNLFPIFFFSLILSAALVFFLYLVPIQHLAGNPSDLPTDSENIRDIGNGWILFDYKDDTYIYRHDIRGFMSSESMARWVDKQ